MSLLLGFLWAHALACISANEQCSQHLSPTMMLVAAWLHHKRTLHCIADAHAAPNVEILD
jgi:hypothetical protein